MDNQILKNVKTWMFNNLYNYLDECGEIDYTKMSEDAIVKFDIEEKNEEEIFTIAAQFEIS